MKYTSKIIASSLLLLLVAVLGATPTDTSQTESPEWPKTFTVRNYPIPGGVVSYSDALPANYNTELETMDEINPSRMEIGDFDEDGNLDFLIPTVFGELGDPVSVEDALQGIVTPLEEIDPNNPWPLLGTWPTPLVLAFGDGAGGIREAAQLTEYTNGSFATIADFDRDGHLDIVCELAVGHPDWPVPNRPLLFLYGDGTGGFPNARYVNVDPTWFVSSGRWLAADMNGDGILDLVSLGYCVSETQETPLGVAVLLGTEEGTFTQGLQACFGQFALTNGSAFDVVDIDLDGDLDLVAAVTSITPYHLDPRKMARIGYLVTFANDGTGQLTTDVSRMIPMLPKAVVTGDFDGDGVIDVAVSRIANAAIEESETRGPNGETLYDYSVLGGNPIDATVFLGDGIGDFDEGTTYDVRVARARLLAGDLNHDGIDDLVSISPEDYRFSVLLGGSANEGESKLYEQRSYDRWAVELADVNSDGLLDLAAFGTAYGQIETTFGDGEGGFGSGWFAAPIETRIPYARSIPTDGGAADFDGDGHLDVAFYDESYPAVGVAFGDGTGRMTEVVSIAFEDIEYRYAISDVVAGDVNHDGLADLLMAFEEVRVGFDESGRSLSRSYIRVRLGSHDRSFPEVSIAAEWPRKHTTGMALGDFNGDGFTDLFVAYYPFHSLPVILPGQGNGTFGAPIEVVPLAEEVNDYETSYRKIFVVDLNEDGLADIAAMSYINEPKALYFGTRTGAVEQVLSFAKGYSLIATADLNADGHSDILTSEGVHLGDGTGVFELIPLEEELSGVPAADFNQDGYLDRINDYQSSLSIYLGDGEFGVLAADAFAASGELDGGFGSYAFGDFNEDGWQDIAYTAGVWLGILLVQPERFPAIDEEEASL